jgi:hypothetical protein
MKYTAFSYAYRDAANFKAHGEIWLRGKLNEAEREQVLAGLESGEYFVAEQLNVPTLYHELYTYSGGRTEDDHAWHSLEGLRFEPLLPENTKLWGKASKLVAAIASASQNWEPELSPNFGIDQ